MATISLEGMCFYAYHGYYEEEQIIGAPYVVDISVTTDTLKAAETDELTQTINYETIFLIVDAEMRQPSRLLEQVLMRIVDALKHQFNNIEGIYLKVKKLNPPLDGQVKSSSVEEEFSFVTSCGRCKRPMICYDDASCWCQTSAVVHPKTMENLRTQYGNKCLCARCLQFYAG